MPEQNNRTRWFPRYSLRGMFVVITVFSVTLGWYAQRALQQRQAVERIVSRQGSVWYDCEIDESLFTTGKSTSRVPVWVCDLLGRNWFHQVAVVDLGSGTVGKELCDDDLKPLLRLSGVRKVTLRDSRQITVTGLYSLSKVTTLEWLYLHRPDIRAVDLQPLRSLPRLWYLALSTPLGDEGLRVLAQFPALTELEIASEDVTDKGVRQCQNLRTLKRLKLSGSYRLGMGLQAEFKSSNPDLGIDDGSFHDRRFRQ